MTAPATPPKPHQRNSARELVETIVFVVVLVLMLKLFVVEAFVIPTGSMAETLYGYHKFGICEQCGYKTAVNASCEIEPEESSGKTTFVAGYYCANCYYQGKFLLPSEGGQAPTSGDRVLVHKAMSTDDRGHVVVFKFPKEPQRKQTAQNYIKRLMGFGGETIVIYRGDIYITRGITHTPPTGSQVDFWKPENMHVDEEATRAKFFTDLNNGFSDPQGFQIFRKSDEILLEMRRVVCDNDFQAKDLIDMKAPPRWAAESAGWNVDSANSPKVFTHSGDQLDWLRYRHYIPVKDQGLLPAEQPRTFDTKDLSDSDVRKSGVVFRPTVITNFLGYNHGLISNGIKLVERNPDPVYWVGDLLLECEAVVGDPSAEMVLELSKGVNRFQAVFAQGKVSLVRTGTGGKELASRPTPITKAGKYKLRFANADCRLRVWVDGQAIDFGTESEYAPALIPKDKEYNALDTRREGWTQENDVDAPARLAAKGNVKFEHLVLWRDAYHTPETQTSGVSSSIAEHTQSFFVQPGHYLCLGDNSTQSSDGRSWGAVPERLMLGRAVFVFFPIPRIGFIR